MNVTMLNMTTTGLIPYSSSTRLAGIGVAAVFLILMIVGLLINGAAIYAYRNSTCLHTPTNTMVIGCSFCDICALAFGFPLVIISGFHGEWIFGDTVCKGYGFVTTMFGVTSICILATISLDRYFIILEKPFAKRITTFRAVMSIIACFGYGLLWATFPVFGWGDFVIEHSKLSCGPDWANQKLSPRTYNITICIFVFVVPHLIISYCYVCIMFKVCQNKRIANSERAQRRLKESRVAFCVLMTILAFTLAWMPYATMSMWSMVNDISLIPETFAIMAPLMAKSSCVFNPLIYVAINGQFRSAFFELLKPRSRGTPNTSPRSDGEQLSTELISAKQFSKNSSVV